MEIDLTLVLFNDELRCHVSRFMNSQNGSYWFGENAMIMHRVPLHDGIVLYVWCVQSAKLAFLGTFCFQSL